MRLLSIFLATFLSLALPAEKGYAEEDTSIIDTLIGNSLKILGKTYVSVEDLELAKQYKIEQLAKMDEGELKDHYDEIYAYISHAQKDFGFTENITPDELLNKIGTLDDKALLEMIDSVPNTVIATKFREELLLFYDSMPDGSIQEKLQFVWQKIIERINSLQGTGEFQ